MDHWLRKHNQEAVEMYIPDDISEIQHPQQLSNELPPMFLEGHETLSSKKSLSIDSHAYGSLKMNHLMYMFLPVIMCVPMYTYYMATSKSQQPPFPHTTITNTACWYPQDIVFRFGMLPAGSFIVFVYFVIFRWIAAEKKRIQYPGETFPRLVYLAQASILGFYGAIGTIDGAGYPDLHTFGAVFFFIVLFIISVVTTVVLREMNEWNSTVLSRESKFIKTVLALYLTLVIIYCVIGLIYENAENDDDDIYVVIMEWNLVFVCLMWLFSFRRDWGNLFVVFKGSPTSEVENKINQV